jgi:hypothetical protein
MSQTLPIESPLLGLNTRDPFIPFESRYARELTNLVIKDGALQMRPAVRATLFNAPFTTTRVRWFDTSEAITEAGDRINTATGVNFGAIGATYAVTCMPYSIKHFSLELAIGLGSPRQTTTPFTAWTFTTLGITATAICAACSHKGRLYVCDGATIEYSDIGQITGAIPTGQTFPISRFMQGESVIRMFSVTALPGNYTSNVLVIFGSGGRVLVYQGDYPGSPSWELIGDFKMPAPSTELCFVEVNGDILIGTNLYCYWFRDLFTAGAQTAFDNRPSMNIDNLWAAVSWDQGDKFDAEASHFYYLSDLNAICCQCFEKSQLSNTGNYANEACTFVYFLEYKAWVLWLATPYFYPVIQGNALGYNGTKVQLSGVYEVDTQKTSTEYPIYTSWKTPYYTPQAGKNRMLGGVKPFFKNVSDGILWKLQAIFDFSDYNNSPFGFYSQPNAAVVYTPANYTDGSVIVNQQASNIYTEFVGLGGNGAAFSIQITQKGEDVTLSFPYQRQIIYKASALLTEGANYPA